MKAPLSNMLTQQFDREPMTESLFEMKHCEDHL